MTVLITARKRFLFDALFILAGALLLCIPAFYNGYPLVSTDSGTYIGCCFEHTLPVDRPIAYGFFIRHLSLSDTLWIPVIVQCILISTVLFLCFRYFSERRQPGFFFLAAIVLLSVFSLLPVYASMLMTDCYTPLALLTGALLLWGKEMPRRARIFCAIVFVFSCMTHLSNLMAAMAAVGVFFLAGFFLRKRKPELFKRSLKVAGLLPLTLLCILLLNRAVGGRWELSPEGRAVFMLNRLVQLDMVNAYLDENCGKKPVTLCNYRDRLDPNSDFLWDPQSPLNQEYGWADRGWAKAAVEYDGIVSDILSKPGNLVEFGGNAIVDAGAILGKTELDAGKKWGEGSAPYGSISWHLPGELNHYASSRQTTAGLDFRVAEMISKIVSIVCLLLMIALLFFRKRIANALVNVLLFIVVFFVSNALVCAVFATVDSRYNTRLLWVLPFYILLVAAHTSFAPVFSQKNKQPEN